MGPAADVISSLEALHELRRRILAGEPVAGRDVSRDRLAGALGPLGITRVGDITDLDRLGIPVWFATRPASKSLCVANGKGLTAGAAWISAVMESAEQALAERADRLIEIVATPRTMSERRMRVVPLERQTRCAGQPGSIDTELGWVRGLCWRTGEPVYAPYELVGMDMVSDAPWDFGRFRISSSGLASGGDLLRAVLHGLRELVEDDAAFAVLRGGTITEERRTLRLSSHHAGLTELLARLERNGIAARFREVTDDIEAPTVLAALHPTEPGQDDQACFSGLACRGSIEDAAVAALLEAAQSRLTFISGSRDDLFQSEYGHSLTPATRGLFGGFELVDRTVAASHPAAELCDLGARITSSGLDFYVFPLGGGELGIEAVRVLADDLVSVDAPPGQRSGRAVRKLLGNWSGSP